MPMTIQVAIVPVTPYQQNCSIIKCQQSGKAAIVDPGGDIDRILDAVKQMDATVEKIILTHGHMDHCAASDVLRRQLTVPIEGPQLEDDFWIRRTIVLVQVGIRTVIPVVRGRTAYERGQE